MLRHVRRLKINSQHMSALRWRKSGSAVQKDKPQVCPQGKKVASRTVNDESIFSFSSQTMVLTH